MVETKLCEKNFSHPRENNLNEIKVCLCENCCLFSRSYISLADLFRAYPYNLQNCPANRAHVSNSKDHKKKKHQGAGCDGKSAETEHANKDVCCQSGAKAQQQNIKGNIPTTNGTCEYHVVKNTKPLTKPEKCNDELPRNVSAAVLYKRNFKCAPSGESLANEGLCSENEQSKKNKSLKWNEQEECDEIAKKPKKKKKGTKCYAVESDEDEPYGVSSKRSRTSQSDGCDSKNASEVTLRKTSDSRETLKAKKKEPKRKKSRTSSCCSRKSSRASASKSKSDERYVKAAGCPCPKQSTDKVKDNKPQKKKSRGCCGGRRSSKQSIKRDKSESKKSKLGACYYRGLSEESLRYEKSRKKSRKSKTTCSGSETSTQSLKRNKSPYRSTSKISTSHHRGRSEDSMCRGRNLEKKKRKSSTGCCGRKKKHPSEKNVSCSRESTEKSTTCCGKKKKKGGEPSEESMKKKKKQSESTTSCCSKKSKEDPYEKSSKTKQKSESTTCCGKKKKAQSSHESANCLGQTKYESHKEVTPGTNYAAPKCCCRNGTHKMNRTQQIDASHGKYQESMNHKARQCCCCKRNAKVHSCANSPRKNEISIGKFDACKESEEEMGQEVLECIRCYCDSPSQTQRATSGKCPSENTDAETNSIKNGKKTKEAIQIEKDLNPQKPSAGKPQLVNNCKEKEDLGAKQSCTVKSTTASKEGRTELQCPQVYNESLHDKSIHGDCEKNSLMMPATSNSSIKEGSIFFARVVERKGGLLYLERISDTQFLSGKGSLQQLAKGMKGGKDLYQVERGEACGQLNELANQITRTLKEDKISKPKPNDNSPILQSISSRHSKCLGENIERLALAGSSPNRSIGKKCTCRAKSGLEEKLHCKNERRKAGEVFKIAIDSSYLESKEEFFVSPKRSSKVGQQSLNVEVGNKFNKDCNLGTCGSLRKRPLLHNRAQGITCNSFQRQLGRPPLHAPKRDFSKTPLLKKQSSKVNITKRKVVSPLLLKLHRNNYSPYCFDDKALTLKGPIPDAQDSRKEVHFEMSKKRRWH